MSKCCIAAGRDGIGEEWMQPSQLSKDATIRKKWIKPVKEQRSNLDSPFLHSLLCSNHFTEDCFVFEGWRSLSKVMNWECRPNRMF